MKLHYTDRHRLSKELEEELQSGLHRPRIIAQGAADDLVARIKSVDRHRAITPQAVQNRELGRAQPDRREQLIIELRHVTGGLADSEAVAILKGWAGIHCGTPK